MRPASACRLAAQFCSCLWAAWRSWTNMASLATLQRAPPLPGPPKLLPNTALPSRTRSGLKGMRNPRLFRAPSFRKTLGFQTSRSCRASSTPPASMIVTGMAGPIQQPQCPSPSSPYLTSFCSAFTHCFLKMFLSQACFPDR